MNFQDLLAKMKQLDETVPAAIGAMAAQAIAKKAKAGNPATPASTDNPWNDAEPTKECGDGDTNPKAVLPSGPNDDMLTGECGSMMSPMSAPKQSDSVTMNVSMNGSGAGGIKDLLDILRNIEKSDGQDSDDILVGIGAEEDFDNTPNPQQVAVPDSGDDLHREKDAYRAVNGGDNPMRMHENLVAKLSAKYEEIKGN